MKSLSDLNRASGRLYPVVDYRTHEIAYTSSEPPSTPDAQVADVNYFLPYRTPYGFSRIVNPAKVYLDFTSSGSTTFTSSNVYTSGFEFSVIVDRTVSSSSLTDLSTLLSLRNHVTFAGIQNSWNGYQYPLTGIGSGTMYAQWGAYEYDGGGNPISWIYTVRGIKNMNDWNLVKCPLISVSNLGSTLEFELKTSLRTDRWSTTFTRNAGIDYGASLPVDTTDSFNANLVNFEQDRYAFQNVDQFIFRNYYPFINESGSSTYISNVSVTGGNIGLTANPTSSYYTLTANVSTTNTNLRSLHFKPAANVTGAKSMTINIQKDSVTLVNKTVDLTILANVPPQANTYVFTSSGTFTPSAAEKAYQLCDIITISGGAGGNKKTTSPGSRLGGRAGTIIANVGVRLDNTSYTINVGAGGTVVGTDGQPGGNTYITGSTSGNVVVALGGGWTNANISGNAITGGVWQHLSGSSNVYGGGGGGAGGPGTDGTPSGAGSGGPGITSSDYYLLGAASPFTTFGHGGNGAGGGQSYTGYGHGGNGATSTQTPGSGTGGLVIIRFY